MIETKELKYYLEENMPNGDLDREYTYEIVARLRAYDKLIESIEKLCHRLSNGVDE